MNQKQRPWMTVIIATYNSARFLPRIAQMLERQIKPRGESDLEILAVDGGSSDGSQQLARELGFRVIENPRGDAIAAKNLGLQHASSRLVCVLDHDEMLLRDDSLSQRFEAFRRDSSLRAMVSAGYRFGDRDSTANMYASEFGDPFSMFTYRCPNNEKLRLKTFKRRLQTVGSGEQVVVFRAGTESCPILCEMAAGSGTIDLDFFREHHPIVISRVDAFPHAYYLLGPDDHIGMMMGDAIQHESVEQWSVVRAKISWRVNNAINTTNVSGSGFVGRTHSRVYSSKRHTLMFIAYAATVALPFFDAVNLTIRRRRLGYMSHFILTYFVVWEAVRLKFPHLLGKSPVNSRYGES